MVKIFSFVGICTTILLADSAFPYIQPVSVEVAPVTKAVEKEVPKITVPVQEVKKVEVKKVEQKVEKDSDGDGVVDSKDKCPNTPKMFTVDSNGCPVSTTLHINFAPNAYDINDELMEKVHEFAAYLKEHDEYDLLILGYTDVSGNADANIVLSKKRADAIKEVLKLEGISDSRMTTIGKGSDNPIADNSTPEGRAQNRRIEIQLIE